MNRSPSRSFSANEKEIEKLLSEIAQWRISLSFLAEEIHFLQILLKADIFEAHEGLFDVLQDHYQEIIDLRTQVRDLIQEVHNHRYDIEGIRECEDISCEVFYHEEHIKLEQKLEVFAEKFRKTKLEIFSYTGQHLKQHTAS